MLIQTEILMNNILVGVLSHESTLNQFSFNYNEKWLRRHDRFPLSPHIPFTRPEHQSNELHSALVRQFFENLLPEGKALDDASIVHQVSKSNVMAMLMAVGKETSGALSVGNQVRKHQLRELPLSEISERIRARPLQPFTVWDGKVRLSIAGYQDKIAALKLDDKFYLTDGAQYASTHILKPEPVSGVLHGMTSNEFFCMRLAKRIKLNVAEVELIHVPEPVLVITRFDRVLNNQHVDRLHYIDGCQALGLPVGHKYERPFGSGTDVAHIRDGASYPLLFNLIEQFTSTPTQQKLHFLRWIIFQVLIGNVDAHAKNISFKSEQSGLSISPVYDLVSGASFKEDGLDKTYAMAIGDAFSSAELSPYEWANFASICGLPIPLVSKTLRKEAQNLLKVIQEVKLEVISEGAEKDHVEDIAKYVELESAKQIVISGEMCKVSKNLLG